VEDTTSVSTHSLLWSSGLPRHALQKNHKVKVRNKLKKKAGPQRQISRIVVPVVNLATAPAPPLESIGAFDNAEEAKVRECNAVLDIIDTVMHTDSASNSSEQIYGDVSHGLPTPESLNGEVPHDVSFASSASVYSRTSSPDPSLPLTPIHSSPIETARIAVPTDQPEDLLPRDCEENCDVVVQNLAQRRGFKGSPLITASPRKKSSFLGPLSPLSPRVFSSMSNLIRPSSPKDSAILKQIPPSVQSDYTQANPFSTISASYYAPYSLATIIKTSNLSDFASYEECATKLHKVPSKLHTSYKRISSVFTKRALRPRTNVYDMAIYGYDDGIGKLKSKLKLTAGASPIPCFNSRVSSLWTPEIIFTPPSAPSSPKKAKSEDHERAVVTDASPTIPIHLTTTVESQLSDTAHGFPPDLNCVMTPRSIAHPASHLDHIMDDSTDDYVPPILSLRRIRRDAGLPRLSPSDLEGLRSCSPPLVDAIDDPAVFSETNVPSQALEGIIVLLGARLDHMVESGTAELNSGGDYEDDSCPYGETGEENLGCAV
jgi:hypothetical protein